MKLFICHCDILKKDNYKCTYYLKLEITRESHSLKTFLAMPFRRIKLNYKILYKTIYHQLSSRNNKTIVRHQNKHHKLRNTSY